MNKLLYQGLYVDPTTKHTKLANSAIENFEKIEHALNTLKEDKLREENVSKVAKTFSWFLKKKSHELNVAKIRKSRSRGNLKAWTAGTEENLI